MGPRLTAFPTSPADRVQARKLGALQTCHPECMENNFQVMADSDKSKKGEQ